jgi:hypothetical protein
VYGKCAICFPSLDGPFVPAEILGDLLPGIEAFWRLDEGHDVLPDDGN